MNGKTLKLLLVAILLTSAYAVYHFEFRTPKINDTANIIENIRKIGQFSSMHYFADMVVIEKRKSDHLFGPQELVLIANCVVNAGFDLQKITPESISVSGDTVFLTLPPIEIFDVIINPSNVEVFHEQGRWSHDEISSASMKAKAKVLREISDKGLLQKASLSGIDKLKEILHTLGFSTVNISVISQSQSTINGSLL